MGRTDIQNANTSHLTTAWAVTRNQLLKKLTDNYFNYNAGMKLIKEKSQIYFEDGGKSVSVEVLLNGNDTVKSYDGFEMFDRTAQKGIVNATTFWKYYGGFITIANTQINENAGMSKVVDLLSSKIMQLEETLNDRINKSLYLDGTAKSTDLVGLKAMAEASATPGAYMGITDDVWVNQYETQTAANIIVGLDNLADKITDGKSFADLILANTKFISAYKTANRKGAAGAAITYVNADKADAGFASFEYAGIPIMLDKALDNSNNAGADTANAGRCYMLTSKHLGLKFNEKPETTDMKDSSGAFAKEAGYSKTVCFGTDRRNRQGVLVLS
jgi:hypothetical protein